MVASKRKRKRDKLSFRSSTSSSSHSLLSSSQSEDNVSQVNPLASRVYLLDLMSKIHHKSQHPADSTTFHSDREWEREELCHVDDWKFQIDSKFQRINYDENSEQDQYIRRRIDFRLPPFLTPHLWMRYRLSLAQIRATMKAFRPIHLWHLALWMRIQVCNIAVQPCFSSPIAVTITAKSPARDEIMKCLHRTYPKSLRCLCEQKENKNTEHIVGPKSKECLRHIVETSTTRAPKHKPPRPQIPIFDTSLEQWKECRFLMQEAKQYLKSEEEKTGQPVSITTPLRYTKAIEIPSLQARYVPYSEDKQGILLQRIIPAAFYFQIYEEPYCIRMEPIYILIQSILFCTTGDYIYFRLTRSEREDRNVIMREGKLK